MQKELVVFVKLFVYFSFIYWFFISWQNLVWAPKFKCPQNWYTTVNLLHIKFSGSVKKASAFCIFSFTLLQQYKKVLKNVFYFFEYTLYVYIYPIYI